MDKWRFLGAGVVVGALLACGAGCTPGGGPVVTESPSGGASVTSVSPSATPSPSPTGTDALLAQLPEGAGAQDVDGATITAVAFVNLLSYIYESQDSALWSALSTPECSYCQHKVGEVEELVASDWTARGGLVSVDSAEVKGAQVDDGYTYVLVPARIDDLFVVSAEGEEQLAEAASEVDFGLQMVFQDGAWRVNGVTLEDR